MDTELAFIFNIQFKYLFVHRILQSFGFFSFDYFRLIVVDNFVSVDVILLPELLFVVVEELVGAVLELHTLHPQAGVRQPAQVRADQPGLAGHLLRQTRAANDPSVFTTTKRGYLVQGVHTHTARVLQVGAGGQDGCVPAVAGGHHPVGALVAAPVLVVEVVPP